MIEFWRGIPPGKAVAALQAARGFIRGSQADGLG